MCQPLIPYLSQSSSFLVGAGTRPLWLARRTLLVRPPLATPTLLRHHRCWCRVQSLRWRLSRHPAAPGSQPLLVLGRPLRPPRLLGLLLIDANERAGAIAATRSQLLRLPRSHGLRSARASVAISAADGRTQGGRLAWATRRCRQVKLWLRAVRTLTITANSLSHPLRDQDGPRRGTAF